MFICFKVLKNSISVYPKTSVASHGFAAWAKIGIVLWLTIWVSFAAQAQDEDAEVVTDSVAMVADTVAEDETRNTHATQQWRPADAEPQFQDAKMRQFDQEKLNDYVNDSDYQYDLQQPSDRLSWWERFKMWLYQKIASLFSSVPGGKDTRNTILLIIAGALLVFAIIKFIGADPRSLFGRKAKSAELVGEEVETDIHSISFEEMIADAISKQQYKRAVRLFYLKSLKQLSDREWIEWQPYKTNYEYVRELKKSELSTDFRQITYLFEYIWYGDFHLDQNSFKETEQQFASFEQKLKMT